MQAEQMTDPVAHHAGGPVWREHWAQGHVLLEEAPAGPSGPGPGDP